MQKHPILTLNRIARTHQLLIQDRILGERHAFTAEILEQPCASEAEARAAKGWKPVEEGYRFGPAYKVFWFRVKGTIPTSWKGKEVAMIAELGGERTVWKDDAPERGIDGPHALYRLADEAEGGEPIELYIQVYTGNPSVRLIGDTPPRHDLTETFNKVEIVQVDTALTQLHYDVLFANDLLKCFPENDPAYATIHRGLNNMCNALDIDRPESIGAARKAIKEALGSLNNEIKHEIVAVGHAHLDTAWLWPLEITHLKMAHTTANQLYLTERYPEYVFVHSQASQYEWLEQEYPSLFAKVQAAVRAGQWEPVGSMWVEADCNLSGGEALVRQFLYGRRYFQAKFGFTTDDMWLPDVFGYAAALPQILNKFGIKYFITQKISWNQTNKFPHNTFFWQGIDGSKIWSHFPPADTYVGSCMPKEIIESVRKHKDQGRSDMSLYIFGHGDGGGGPTEEHLELLKRAKTAPGLPEIETDRFAVDLFREAKAKSKDLMTWSGELYLEMHRGTFTSQANNKKFNRQSEFLLRDAEFLACFVDAYPKTYPAAKIEELWKLVLLNQFHDIIPGSSVREVYEDSDRDYAKVLNEGSELVSQSLTAIAAKLDTENMEHPVALFANTTLVTQGEIPWTSENIPSALRCAENTYPVQLVEEFGERKLIFETPSEAIGAVAVGDLCNSTSTSHSRLKIRDRKIENAEWRVRFDGNGNITSISSLDDGGTEFIEQGKLANYFEIFEDRPNFWGAWDIDPWAYETARPLLKAESVQIVERGPVRVALEIVRKISEKSWIKQRISLGPTPGIRFDTEIEWRESHKLLKVAFPLNLNAVRATYEIQYGHVERPTHSNTSWDAAKFEVPAQKWVDVSEGDMGVALLNDSKYGFDCNGSTLRMSLLRAPKAPDPECDMGRHRFSYVLLPHFDQIVHSDINAAAYALNAPLRTANLEATPGQAGALPKFVHVETRNLIVDTVKKAEDSDLIVVRLYECHNTRGVTSLSCILGAKRAWLTNLNEEIEQELEVNDGQIEVRYKPFEILTIAIEV